MEVMRTPSTIETVPTKIYSSTLTILLSPSIPLIIAIRVYACRCLYGSLLVIHFRGVIMSTVDLSF